MATADWEVGWLRTRTPKRSDQSWVTSGLLVSLLLGNQGLDHSGQETAAGRSGVHLGKTSSGPGHTPYTPCRRGFASQRKSRALEVYFWTCIPRRSQAASTGLRAHCLLPPTGHKGLARDPPGLWEVWSKPLRKAGLNNTALRWTRMERSCSSSSIWKERYIEQEKAESKDEKAAWGFGAAGDATAAASSPECQCRVQVLPLTLRPAAC